jgi:hypothetical protein
MKATLAGALALAAISFAFPASADDLKWRGGIGVIPVSSGAGTAATAEVVNRNLVRGVQPPGQIWVIEDLKAEIDLDSGQVRADGRGLLLGGGNNVGLNGGQSVKATLICEVPVAPATTVPLFDSGVVALEANGDFRIDDVLTPRPPTTCASPVLLIRNAGGAWFAAGIPKR